jgi:hypothetical protein
MASRYFRNTGNNSWIVATNWSATDGGASVGAAPTTADDVFFTALSGATCNVGSNGVGLTLNCTGYTGTLTILTGITLTFTSNITLSSGMTFAVTGTGQLNINTGPCTLTTNGKTIPALQVASNAVITPSGALSVTTLNCGNCSFAGATGWTAGTFNVIGAGVTVTLAASTTYNVTGTFGCGSPDAGSHYLVKSGTPATKANINLTGIANLGWVDFTDINATGRKIYTFEGTVTTCTNVTQMIDRPVITTANSFII